MSVRAPVSGRQDPVVLRYARLFETFSAHDQEIVHRELAHTNTTLQEHHNAFRFLAFGLPKNKAADVLDILAEKLSLCVLTRSFLRTFSQKGHVRMLPDLVRHLHDEGYEVVHLISATLLSEKDIQNKTAQLKEFLQKPIHLYASHDPHLLGGEVVFWRSKMLDTSLASTLETFQKEVIPHA